MSQSFLTPLKCHPSEARNLASMSLASGWLRALKLAVWHYDNSSRQPSSAVTMAVAGGGWRLRPVNAHQLQRQRSPEHAPAQLHRHAVAILGVPDPDLALAFQRANGCLRLHA